MKRMNMLMCTKGIVQLMLLISSFELTTPHIKYYYGLICFNYTFCRIRVAAAAAASSMARAPSIRRLTAQKVSVFVSFITNIHSTCITFFV